MVWGFREYGFCSLLKIYCSFRIRVIIPSRNYERHLVIIGLRRLQVYKGLYKVIWG